MADEISIGSKAIKEVQDLRAELVKLSEDALKAGKSMSTISTPGGLNKSGADNAKTGAELDALKAKYSALSESIAKSAEKSRLAEIKLQQTREKAFDSFEKNAKKEAALAEKNAQLYNKTDAQIKKLTIAYNELAVRKERYNNLNANEEMRVGTLSRVLEKYNGIQKSVDATIGKNGRNVGNYASGYNALGNSINQLTREAPAFANSLQTGFMAISNNFAALQDAIKGIIAQNRILAAEGKPTVSVFKQLAESTFSWTTLISIGVTLLTVYGAKLVEMAMGLGDVKSELNKVERVQKKWNASLEEANKNIDHNLKLEKNRQKELSKNTSETLEKNAVLDKEAAKAKLKNFETVRDIAKKELDLEVKKILTKKQLTSFGYEEEINSVEQLNANKIALEKSLGKEIVKFNYLARTDKEKLEVEALVKVNSKLASVEALNESEVYKKKKENYLKAYNATIAFGQSVSELSSDLNTDLTEDEKKRLEDRLKNIAEMNKAELLLQLAKNDILLNNEDAYYSDRITALNTDLAIRNRISKLDYDEDVRLAKDSQEKKKTALLNYQIENLKLTQDYIKKRSELEKLDLDAITKLTKPLDRNLLLKELEDSASKAGKQLERDVDKAEKLRLKLLELKGVTSNWLKSFSSEFLQNSGMGSLETFFDGTFNSLLAGAETTQDKFAVTFNAIAESAQQAFNLISGYSQKNFDSERERLQSQYDVSLKYAGDNKAAQEKLAEDLEAKKKDIANREAKAKQKQAIFNIAIDTAQAIIGLWAKPGFPAAIPLAIAVGALGVAQIAMVSSQEIPQYWMGGTHDGGMMMVNDGSGNNYRETIVTPDGNIHKPQGRNVVMNAPIGTEIFTHDQWNDQMNDMLKGNGINWSIPAQQQNGISKNDMREAMLEAIREQPQYHTNFDGDGVVSYIEKRGNITRTNTNRSNGRGIKF